jgi:hypothetical protein
VSCLDETASLFVAKVLGEVLAYFMHFYKKVTVISVIYCLGCRGKFSVNNPLDGIENDDHPLDFVRQLPHYFLSWSVKMFLLGGLLLSFKLITVNPAVINSDNPEQQNSTTSEEWRLLGCYTVWLL